MQEISRSTGVVRAERPICPLRDSRAMTSPPRAVPGQGIDPLAWLASIVASSDDAIISKTLDGIVTSWNTAAERLFDYREDEAVGRALVELIIPEEHRAEEDMILGRVRRGERVEHFETVRHTKSRKRLPVSITVSPVRDAGGNVVGASKIARDITEQRRLHEERVQLLESERAARAEAERMVALKDEFLSTLSHELRSPLSAILGWAQVLRHGSRSPADMAGGLEIIERNARVQSQLIDDLLDMSRINSGTMRLDVQPVMPAPVVQAAVDSVRPSADAKGIHLRVILDEKAGPISGDPARFQQIAWNLLSNAIKFTPRGGRVKVLLQRVNSHIEFSVADTGVGIPPDFLPYVFERFRQADASSSRRVGGLGLGLSIVKRLVELHGGTVRAKSLGAGEGATFSVDLPLLAVHPNGGVQALHPGSPRAIPMDAEPVDLRGIRILVVDDEPDGRQLVGRLLRDCGADVTEAGDAAEALDAVKRVRPSIIVSDIGMADVDGYELLRRIRTLSADEGGRIPAIALTAFARSEDRTRALRSGFLAHVAKPVEPSELIATVAAVTSR
jgi:PAS domain S-box-containing protein